MQYVENWKKFPKIPKRHIRDRVYVSLSRKKNLLKHFLEHVCNVHLYGIFGKNFQFPI